MSHRVEEIERTPRAERLTEAQWRLILAFYNNRCAYCGVEGVPLQKEHRQPLCQGGLHTATNIVPACRSCNAHKYDLSEDKFRAYLSWPADLELSCGHVVPKRRPTHVLPFSWCLTCGEETSSSVREFLTRAFANGDGHRIVWRDGRIVPDTWAQVKAGDISTSTSSSVIDPCSPPLLKVARQIIDPEIRPIVGIFPYERSKGRWHFNLCRGSSVDKQDWFYACGGHAIRVYRSLGELRQVNQTWLEAVLDLALAGAELPAWMRPSVKEARAYMKEWQPSCPSPPA